MISARSFQPSGFSPFAAEIRGPALIPASCPSLRIANLNRYNTTEGAEFRIGTSIFRERWNIET